LLNVGSGGGAAAAPTAGGAAASGDAAAEESKEEEKKEESKDYSIWAWKFTSEVLIILQRRKSQTRI
jgi:hypothetical protein